MAYAEQPPQRRRQRKSSKTFSLNPGPSLYERSQMAQKEKERKIRKLRQSLERDLTFTPNCTAVVHQKSPLTIETKTSSSTATTSTPASSKSGESVFDRLYGQPQRRRGSNASTWNSPPPQQNRSRAASRTSVNSSSFGTTRNASSRVEELYAEGIRKSRSRPTSDKHEREIREERLAREQATECTFFPRIRWGQQQQNQQHQARRTQRLLEPRMMANNRSSALQINKGIPKKQPPLEIKVFKSTTRAWHAPVQPSRLEQLRSVSPLPVPDIGSVNDNVSNGDDYSLATTIVSRANQTEYGSI